MQIKNKDKVWGILGKIFAGQLFFKIINNFIHLWVIKKLIDDSYYNNSQQIVLLGYIQTFFVLEAFRQTYLQRQQNVDYQDQFLSSQNIMKLCIYFTIVLSFSMSIFFYILLPQFQNCFYYYSLQSLESILISMVEYLLVNYYLKMDYDFLSFFNPIFDINQSFIFIFLYKINIFHMLTNLNLSRILALIIKIIYLYKKCSKSNIIKIKMQKTQQNHFFVDEQLELLKEMLKISSLNLIFEKTKQSRIFQTIQGIELTWILFNDNLIGILVCNLLIPYENFFYNFFSKLHSQNLPFQKYFFITLSILLYFLLFLAIYASFLLFLIQNYHKNFLGDKLSVNENIIFISSNLFMFILTGLNGILKQYFYIVTNQIDKKYFVKQQFLVFIIELCSFLFLRKFGYSLYAVFASSFIQKTINICIFVKFINKNTQQNKQKEFNLQFIYFLKRFFIFFSQSIIFIIFLKFIVNLQKGSIFLKFIFGTVVGLLHLSYLVIFYEKKTFIEFVNLKTKSDTGQKSPEIIQSINNVQFIQQNFSNIQILKYFDGSDDLNTFLKKGYINQRLQRGLSNSEIKKMVSKIDIPQNEIQVHYTCSSGPGGQHVNKTASKAVLKFHIQDSQILTEDTKKQMLKNLSSKINKQGELILSSQKYRESHQNLKDVIQRLKTIIASNQVEEINQIVKFEESDFCEERRIKDKKMRSQKKKNRSNSRFD